MKNPTFGQLFAIAGQVADVLRSNPSVDGDETQKAILSPEHPFWSKIAEAVFTLVSMVKVLLIDYSMSLTDMVKAGGYDWVNPNITEDFHVEGSGTEEVEYMLVHPNRSISSENAILAIQAEDTKNPWQPAKIQHLLAFGAKNPEEQRKYPIVALGSVARVDGNRRVVCLSRRDTERALRLGYWNDVWFDVCRFLAIRKVSKILAT